MLLDNPDNICLMIFVKNLLFLVASVYCIVQGAYIRQVREYPPPPPPPSVPNIGHGVLAKVTISGRSYQAAIVEST